MARESDTCMKVKRLQLIEGAKQAEGLTVIIDVFRAFSLECYLYDAHPRYNATNCLLFRNLRGLNSTTLACHSISIIIILTYRKKKKNH